MRSGRFVSFFSARAQFEVDSRQNAPVLIQMLVELSIPMIRFMILAPALYLQQLRSTREMPMKSVVAGNFDQ